MLRVNLDGLYLMCRASSDAMRQNGYGRIVSVSSNSIFAGTPNMAHYVASKGGVLTFSRALATELGAHKITVNCVCPGLTDTEGVRKTDHVNAFEFVDMLQAIKGRGIPEDIVPAIASCIRRNALDHRSGPDGGRRHGALVGGHTTLSGSTAGAVPGRCHGRH